MIERGINLGLIPLIKAEEIGKAKAAEAVRPIDPDSERIPRGLMSPAIIAEKRAQVGVRGYVMGQPRR
jgi:hypothetical protein